MKITIFSILIFIFSLSVYAQDYMPEMVIVEGGTFLMGNEESEFYDEFPAHNVSLNSYFMSKYEITIKLYKVFCQSAGKKIPRGSDQKPAHSMSWQESILFCNWLSMVNNKQMCYKVKETEKSFYATLIPEANGFRLPTEAEWEYAARGGNKSKYYSYSGSNSAADVAWFLFSGHELKDVGQKQPNELGIYDMSGNVLEFCYDNYNKDYYKKRASDNPTGAELGSRKVARGGSYQGSAEALRISKRFSHSKTHAAKTLGLRLVYNAE
ncbi:MAG: SUMF1/EgtB/PvdO family nonheme iron enzyme [Bacteroidota bacterium]|nr:SUMF1/EgtB/PvdO family nonheme iron enzyme [Bacteroidota bacterium]